MKLDNTDKINRILEIYTELMNGCVVEKTKKAQDYDVNERSIERDINDIRNFIRRETGESDAVVFDKKMKGYRLEKAYTSCQPNAVVEKMSEIGKAIWQCRYLHITYKQEENRMISEMVKPIAIMFSEGYFYMAAFWDEEASENQTENAGGIYPSMYRIDCIKKVKMQEEPFRIPYGCKFEEGEFRQQIPFLYGGKLRDVKFRCPSTLKAEVMERFPTAKIFQEDGEVYTMSAQVLGKEVEIWIKNHSEETEILEQD